MKPMNLTFSYLFSHINFDLPDIGFQFLGWLVLHKIYQERNKAAIITTTFRTFLKGEYGGHDIELIWSQMYL